jgi:hypothetical protein
MCDGVCCGQTEDYVSLSHFNSIAVNDTGGLSSVGMHRSAMPTFLIHYKTALYGIIPFHWVLSNVVMDVPVFYMVILSLFS